MDTPAINPGFPARHAAIATLLSALFFPFRKSLFNFATKNKTNREIQKMKTRNSNIEVLRIVAMFMVLILHVDFLATGSPSAADFSAQPIQSFFKIFFEMACIISVNLFVFISGWFGIKAGFKGFCRYMFQCVCILVIIGALGAASGLVQITKVQLLELFYLKGNGWFVLSYAFLYVLSPVLNAFCEITPPKSVRNFLVAFFLLQTLYGTMITAQPSFIANGYSAFSFIGIYMLARYMRKHGQRWYEHGLKFYFVSAALLVATCLFPYVTGHGFHLIGKAMNYTCPFNIAACAGLVMYVANLRPRHSRTVNFVASSVFAVYLVHCCTGWATDEYLKMARAIYDGHSGIGYLAVIVLFMTAVFLGSILIDQLRKILWNAFSRYLPNRWG